jgi:hypothetical protein
MGAILFEDTMNREINGVPTTEFLWKEKNVVSEALHANCLLCNGISTACYPLTSYTSVGPFSQGRQGP